MKKLYFIFILLLLFLSGDNVLLAYKCLGIYKISHYDSCMKCCNKIDGITYSGKKASSGTIAVDKKKIKLGSVIKIDDKLYRAEDIGGAIKGNRIDIWCKTHQEALNKGIYYTKVYLVN